MRQTITPSSLDQFVTVHLWLRRPDRFHASKAKPSIQRMLRKPLMKALVLGLSVRWWWKTEVAMKEASVRTETVIN